MSVILPCRLRQCRAPLSAVLVVISLLMGGCAGSPADQAGVVINNTPSDASSPSTSEPTVAKDTAFQLLQQAETAASPQRESLLLQASAYYQQQGDYTRMGRALQEIHMENLPDDLRVRYSLQYGDWAITQRRLADADRVLLDARLNTGLEAADAAQLHGLRSRLYELESKPIDALNERMAQSLLVPEAGQREVSDATWRVLSQLSPTDIEFLDSADTSNRAEEQLLAGWLALARIQRNDTGNLDKQAADVKDWQRSYPLHPANRFMPADMAMTADGTDKTRRIALLLPLTGKRASAGQALRDGFMTMHYKQLAGANADVQIDLVDSSASPDILNTYNNAVAQGAQLVIGPLEREQVQILAAQSSLPVPTLALNNPLQANSPQTGISTELYQFSLNPEDDVTQVANAAAASRLHKALVIAPQGERGERLVQAFLRSWSMAGGETVGQMRYAPGTGNYSVQLADTLGIDLASGKMRSGKTLPDMVFFVGTGADASVMMETLARNGGGGLPVYATAQVLAGQYPDQRANGLRLCIAPWQAGSGPLRAEGVTGTAAADTDMLFAMGADAQALYTRLTMLDGNPSLHVPGNTGYLSMDTRHRVIRTLVWGVMQDGQLQVQAASGHF